MCQKIIKKEVLELCLQHVYDIQNAASMMKNENEKRTLLLRFVI